jgi:hypothetical protein
MFLFISQAKQAETLTSDNKTLVEDISSIKSFLRSRGENVRSNSKNEGHDGKKGKRVLLPSSNMNEYVKQDENEM